MYFLIPGAIFEGGKNSIWMTREYYLDYGCQYVLQLYPFDTQVIMSAYQPDFGPGSIVYIHVILNLTYA